MEREQLAGYLAGPGLAGAGDRRRVRRIPARRSCCSRPTRGPARLPALRLILAPRHIERAAEVWLSARRADCSARPLSGDGAAWDVLVVDRYGVLVDMYRLADVVVMGGTYHPKVGGHNVLEATLLGKPVIVGPSTFGITAQLEMLRAAEGVVEAQPGGLARRSSACWAIPPRPPRSGRPRARRRSPTAARRSARWTRCWR